MLQWLRLQASSIGAMDSIPGQGTMILHATWCDQKIVLMKLKFALKQQFSSGMILLPRGHLVLSGNISGLSQQLGSSSR